MSLVSTEPGLVLKATPPRLQKSATARPRLSLDSAELADKAAIALQAPAGFGKTQLLAQWRRDAWQIGAGAAVDDEGRHAACHSLLRAARIMA